MDALKIFLILNKLLPRSKWWLWHPALQVNNLVIDHLTEEASQSSQNTSTSLLFSSQNGTFMHFKVQSCLSTSIFIFLVQWLRCASLFHRQQPPKNWCKLDLLVGLWYNHQNNFYELSCSFLTNKRHSMLHRTPQAYHSPTTHNFEFTLTSYISCTCTNKIQDFMAVPLFYKSYNKTWAADFDSTTEAGIEYSDFHKWNKVHHRSIA